MGLPFLESVAAAGGAPTPPLRMAYIFVPNGVNLREWTPATEGYGYNLPYVLQPLAPVQDDVMVISGLTHDKGRGNGDGPGDHARSASVFLTGAQPRKTSGADIRSGMSVDQAAATVAGKATRFASLELGCEAGRSAGNCDSGYSCAYSSSVSWSSEATPLGKETNPRAVFERLFGNGKPKEVDQNKLRRDALKKSILDFITEDAKRLQHRLGRNDQQKLDEYLTGVREVEQRLQRTESETQIASELNYPIPEGIPADYSQHIRLLSDMMVLAFQTDSTRISTFMFANAGSNRSYRPIGVADGHHDLSHHGDKADKLEKIGRINNFHVNEFSYLLQKMKSTSDGEGNLLDNSMIVYGSGLSDGNRHNNENLPVLLAGHGSGSIDSGRHLRVAAETPMCNLFMSLLDRFGTPANYIGDSTGQLSGLKI